MRDLITTGILAALYMVCAMIGEAIFGFFPVLTFPLPAVYCAAVRPVYMLILAKVPKHGPNHCHRYFGRRCTVRTRYVLVYVFGILYSRRLASPICLPVPGTLETKGRNLLSYMIFVLSPVFSYGMLWFDRDAYVQYLVEREQNRPIWTQWFQPRKTGCSRQ